MPAVEVDIVGHDPFRVQRQVTLVIESAPGTAQLAGDVRTDQADSGGRTEFPVEVDAGKRSKRVGMQC